VFRDDKPLYVHRQRLGNTTIKFILIKADRLPLGEGSHVNMLFIEEFSCCDKSAIDKLLSNFGGHSIKISSSDIARGNIYNVYVRLQLQLQSGAPIYQRVDEIKQEALCIPG
jgi:hypothetical protein